MVRAPRAVDSTTWTPGGEQWLFITAGVAEQPSRPVLETKTTVGSHRRCSCTGARGWVEGVRPTAVPPRRAAMARRAAAG
jgi:hypothetical protein